MKGGLGFLFIRSKLFKGIYNERVKEEFELTMKSLEGMDTNFNKFMLEMMKLSKIEIENNNLEVAAYDVNLLHNLPETIYNGWNEDYFFNNQLLGYFEHMSDFKRVDKIKIVIKLVSKYLLSTNTK